MADHTYAEYAAGTSNPPLTVDWRTAGRQPRDFLTDTWDFTLVLADSDDPATLVVDKTTGFVPADFVPALTVTWDPDADIAVLAPGVYEGHIYATSEADNTKAEMPLTIRIKPVVGTSWGA